MTDALADAAERFARDTAGHQLEIAHDDGLYRHLRFRGGPAWAYWFDLITAPGVLIFQGDGEAFVFSRTEDMFQFFRDNPDRPKHRISPGYWSQKLISDQRGIRRFSPELFAELVREAVEEATEGGRLPGLAAAVVDDMAGHDLDHAESARDWVERFAYWESGGSLSRRPDFTFSDAWEWDARDWHWWFLWACHAIVWGVARYDEAKTAG